MSQPRRTGDMGTTRRIHMVGIGGIGMSSIAEVLLNRGFEITGSDLKKSDVTARLEELGATTYEQWIRDQMARVLLLELRFSLASPH